MKEQFRIGNRPTAEQTRDLHTAYREYIKASPWRHLPDDAPLVIHNADERHTCYIATNADHGATGAMACYSGRAGLEAYLRSHEHVPFNNHCMSVSQVTPQQMRESELREMGRLNAGYRRNSLRPRFRSHLPHHPPWSLNAEETVRMTRVLRDARDLGLYAREHHGLPGQPPRDPELPAQAPVWSRQNGVGALSWHVLPTLADIGTSARIEEPDAMEQKLPDRRDATEHWIISEIVYPFTIYDRAGQTWRPFHPVLTVAYSPKGSPDRTAIASLNRYSTSNTQSILYAIFSSMGRLPGTITVASSVAARCWLPVGEHLAIEIRSDPEADMPVETLAPALEALTSALHRGEQAA